MPTDARLGVTFGVILTLLLGLALLAKPGKSNSGIAGLLEFCNAILAPAERFLPDSVTPR